MKNIFLSILAVFTATVLLNCQFLPGASKEKPNFDKDSSYALGLVYGTRLKEGMVNDAIRPDFNDFFKGIKDGVYGKKSRLSLDEAIAKVNVALIAIEEERNAITKQKGIAYLADNAKKPGIQITKSGLQYEVLVEGKGKKPVETDTVKVHYEGRLIDGTLFDNTYERQEAATLPLADVIPGWKEGLQLMTVGSKYRFYIPYELGYGAEGVDNLIPPYSTLLFVVELADIVSKKAAVQEDDYWW
ncbi:MAG: FKBP-type peptidyl-prolyl cis-trans isomerase [Spirochaetes bacterium]|nr:FKBP-type peptidyl-prolyl cis-trans isomerase [Spirochaetota bacterium]